MEIVFSEFRNDYCRFLEALRAVFLFLSFENRLENEANFGVVKNPEFVIWWRRSLGYLAPLKT